MKKETKMQTSLMKIVTILPEGYSGNAEGYSGNAEGYSGNAEGYSSNAEGYSSNTEGYSSNAEEPSNKAGGRFIRKTVQYASADSSGMYKT